MSQAVIVPIPIDSAAALAAMHQRCMTAADAWDEAGLASLLMAGAARGFQAETDGRGITGFVLAFAAADEAEVLALCVAPEHRRQGLGRKLLKHLERQLVSEQITRLHLEARASNLPARELYTRAGFTGTGRRKLYYPLSHDAPAEDAVLMAKAIGSQDRQP